MWKVTIEFYSYSLKDIITYSKLFSFKDEAILYINSIKNLEYNCSIWLEKLIYNNIDGWVWDSNRVDQFQEFNL